MALWISLTVAAVFLLAQIVLVWIFDCASRRNQPRHDTRWDDSTAVTVIVCARGRDPHLAECLQAIAAQSRPADRCLFVVDHWCDPGLEALASLTESQRGQWTTVVASPLDDRCSLKCNSLRIAWELASRQSDVVCLVDSDAVPDRHWIESAVQQLQLPIGAVFANRWYVPQRGNLGSWLRHIWNSAAIVQMCIYRIVWGGGLAVRVDAATASGLADRWGEALFEDTLIAGQMWTAGYASRAMTANYALQTDRCSVTSMFGWAKRQLLDTRLYHRRWPLVFGHAVLSAVIPAGLLVWGVLQAAEGKIGEGAFFAGFWLALLAANAALLLWIERIVAVTLRRSQRAASDTVLVGSDWGRFLRYFAYQSIVQWLNLWGAMQALRTRSITWRGIAYRINGADRIVRTSYQTASSIEP